MKQRIASPKNSKEVFRFAGGVGSGMLIRVLRENLNRGRYRMRVRGRKPNKVKMELEGLPSNYFSKDGSIPMKFATELAVYIDTIDTDPGFYKAQLEKYQKGYVELLDQWNERNSRVHDLETELCEIKTLRDNLYVNIRSLRECYGFVKKRLQKRRDEVDQKDRIIADLKNVVESQSVRHNETIDDLVDQISKLEAEKQERTQARREIFQSWRAETTALHQRWCEEQARRIRLESELEAERNKTWWEKLIGG